MLMNARALSMKVILFELGLRLINFQVKNMDPFIVLSFRLHQLLFVKTNFQNKILCKRPVCCQLETEEYSFTKLL